MANTIELAKIYLPLLDEVYQNAAVTSILDVNNAMVRDTGMANSVLIPKMLLQGLGDYDKAAGFVKGDVTLSWETHTFTQDRGRTFQVDAVDNEETLQVAFGSLAAEFIRTKVVPEVDAYRFATYADKAGTVEDADLTDSTTLAAIDTAIMTMDEAEVPAEGRILFITPTVYNLLKSSDAISRRFDVQTGNGNVDRRIELFDGMQVRKVPQTRFYSAITLLDGSTTGQEDGGYSKASAGLNLNFMLIHPSAVVQITKTAMPRIFDPMTNQSANAWKFDYRLYHDTFVPDNKVNGIYAHTVAAGA